MFTFIINPRSKALSIPSSVAFGDMPIPFILPAISGSKASRLTVIRSNPAFLSDFAFSRRRIPLVVSAISLIL